MENENKTEDQTNKSGNKLRLLITIPLLILIICIPILGFIIGTSLVTGEKVDEGSSEETVVQDQDNIIYEQDHNILENEVEPPSTAYPTFRYSGWREFVDEKNNFTIKYPMSYFDKDGRSYEPIPEVYRKGDKYKVRRIGGELREDIWPNDDISFTSEDDYDKFFNIQMLDNPESLSPKEYWKKSIEKDVVCIPLEGRRERDGYCYSMHENRANTYEFIYFISIVSIQNKSSRDVYFLDRHAWDSRYDEYIIPLDETRILKIRSTIFWDLAQIMIESMTFLE